MSDLWKQPLLLKSRTNQIPNKVVIAIAAAKNVGHIKASTARTNTNKY